MECDPIGYQPEATEFAEAPACGTAASANVRYGPPRKVSRSVSKPSAGSLTA